MTTRSGAASLISWIAVRSSSSRNREPPTWTSESWAISTGPSQSPSYRSAKASRQEVEQELVDALRRVELKPVARAVDPLVAPRSRDVLARSGHALLEQVVVADAPDPERRSGHGR